MTPGEIAAIMVRLDHQDEAIGEIKQTVHETLKQAKTTNGRVTALEQERAIAKALLAQAESMQQRRASRHAWLTPAVAACGSTFGAVVLAHFL